VTTLAATEGTSAGGDPLGRWPANLIHDGSDEVLAAFPDAKGQQGATTGAETRTASVYGEFAGVASRRGSSDTGSAARFFYCPKASRSDRDEGLDGFEVKPAAAMQGNLVAGQRLAGNGAPIATPVRANTHPTVKPTDLMRYLCRLVTPPGGTVLDPFMGSGSTGKAAVLEGFRFVGVDMSPEYLNIARARIEHAFLQSLGC
jgi:site-specific DNA-methyltransferase (adenine-specific)